MDEFSIIANYFNRQTDTSDGVRYGIGDDCAVLSLPADHQLVVSTDTMLEGAHFLSGAPPDKVAWRLLSAATSDLAAMGAYPLAFTLGLTLPNSSDAWLQPFSQGLHEAADHYQIPLVGGDTTKGPLCLTVTVQGSLPKETALMRQGAQLGDLVCVTGTLGDSRAGLEQLLSAAKQDNDTDVIDAAALSYFLNRFYQPEARLQVGQLLRGKASSCIDISDGLSSDLNHILRASGLGAEINLAKLPLSNQLKQHYAAQAEAWALHGGEDFELCFTLAADQFSSVKAAAAECGVDVTAIGKLTSTLGLFAVRGEEKKLIEPAGFNHFSIKNEAG